MFSVPRGQPVCPVMSGAWTGSLGAITGHGGAVGPSGQRAQSPSSAATIVKKVEWENESSFRKVIFTRCHILCFPQVAISLHAFCLYF